MNLPCVHHKLQLPAAVLSILFYSLPSLTICKQISDFSFYPCKLKYILKKGFLSLKPTVTLSHLINVINNSLILENTHSNVQISVSS